MVIMNNSNESARLVSASDYKEVTSGYQIIRNVMTGEQIEISDTISVAPKSSIIFDLD
jgi:hypothetical protein